MCNRIKCLAIEEAGIDIDAETAQIIAGHHLFMYRANILRYWWRLSYKDRKELLVTYKNRCYLVKISWFHLSGDIPAVFNGEYCCRSRCCGLRYVYLKKSKIESHRCYKHVRKVIAKSPKY